MRRLLCRLGDRLARLRGPRHHALDSEVDTVEDEKHERRHPARVPACHDRRVHDMNLSPRARVKIALQRELRLEVLPAAVKRGAVKGFAEQSLELDAIFGFAENRNVVNMHE